LDIQIKDISTAPIKHTAPKMNIVETYDYTDAAGKLVYQVCRLDPKGFRQRRPDPSKESGWSWDMKGVVRLPFNLPKVIDSVANEDPIVIVEGEKDVNSVIDNTDITATCNSGGAEKWQANLSPYFKEATVCIVADKDTPGRKHAQDVAGKLHGTASSIKVLELPDTGGKLVKDAHDYFAAGGTPEEFRKIIDDTPEWEPTAKVESATESNTMADSMNMPSFILKTLTNKNIPPLEKDNAISNGVLKALLDRSNLYYHSDLKDFDSCMIFDKHLHKLDRIGSDSFRAWLSNWTSVNRSDSMFNDIFCNIETAALSSSHTTGILPESFWASRPGAVYLSNGEGKLVKITAQGVELLDNGTDGVLFSCGNAMATWELVEPKDPFETCAMFRDINCENPHGKTLLQLWVYSLATCPKEKPPLCTSGAPGSGKTKTLSGICELYGIPSILQKVEEKREGDFWPNIDQGGILILDNADTKCTWLADTLSSAATFGASQRRKLYANRETVTLRARSWIGITTCNPSFASDAGLADRLLVVRMNRREVGNTSNSILSAEIAANRNAGLSHIAMILQRAMADAGPTPAGLNARHPDFATFAVKIGRALGREHESIGALKAAEEDKSQFCIENDSTGTVLVNYINEKHSFTGTAQELLAEINLFEPEFEKLSVKSLGMKIKSMWPHIEKLFSATKTVDRTGKNVYTFKNKTE
jgi:hypothetical protein